MPLVQCPDCAKSISDAAPACPNCGRPMIAAAGVGAAQVGITGEPVVTIQGTSKSIKLWKLLSVVGIAVGAVMSGRGGAPWFAIGGMLLTLSIISYVIASFAKWWKHD